MPASRFRPHSDALRPAPLSAGVRRHRTRLCKSYLPCFSDRANWRSFVFVGLAADAATDTSSQILEVHAFQHCSFRGYADEHGVLRALRYSPGVVRFDDDICTRPFAAFYWLYVWCFAVDCGFVGHLFHLELLCGEETPCRLTREGMQRTREGRTE